MNESKRHIVTTCPECAEESSCLVIRQDVVIEYRGKRYPVVEEFAQCPACGAEFDALGLLDPLEAVYESYRAEHAFPTAAQIQQLRQDLGLDHDGFARKLGTSRMTVKLYERGALPSDEHAAILKVLVAMHGMRRPPEHPVHIPDFGKDGPPIGSLPARRRDVRLLAA